MSNREIKFRVRETKPSKRWAYFSIPHKIIWEGVWDLETLGQYTGLKDAKGKEIYEGDVVRDIEGTLYPIICKPGYFTVGQKSITPVGVWVEEAEIEIIGNIYEHSDLLPDTNTPQGN